MRALAKTDLLMLDDWGLVTISPSEARELLEVIDDRCTRRSTLIASQLPIDTWHSAIPRRHLTPSRRGIGNSPLTPHDPGARPHVRRLAWRGGDPSLRSDGDRFH